MNLSAKLLFLLMLLIVGCDGCDTEIDDPNPTGTECQFGNFCPGAAECDDGFCNCPEESGQLARGFCIQGTEGVVFASFDVYPGMMDTTVLHFDEEPFSTLWEDGDPFNKLVSGKSYNRNPDAVSSGSIAIATFVYPGDPTIPVDSVLIIETYDNRNQPYGPYYFPDTEWQCRGATFVGKFIDRNTLKGELLVGPCETTDGSPRPDFLMNDGEGFFPVTYHRIPAE